MSAQELIDHLRFQRKRDREEIEHLARQLALAIAAMQQMQEDQCGSPV